MTLQRQRLTISGVVQGVGFRPYVYRLATHCGLSGWVANTPGGVALEIQGEASSLEAFRQRLPLECPSAARLDTLTAEPRPLQADSGFEVKASHSDGQVAGFVLPDLAPCAQCLFELFDPANRRYRYPFISCTDCGPRWSLMTALPFDRVRTTMAGFRLCQVCEAEYRDSSQRRFHAQTQCCADCGPQLSLTDRYGNLMARAESALEQAISVLEQGKILAVKGVGGYQLLVDATQEAAVTRLRLRKSRPAKPLAILCATTEDARRWALVSNREQAALESAAAPIVLLQKNPSAHPGLAQAVTFDLPLIGILLPSSPLHHLLIRALGFPLVVTSGNRSGEPLATDNHDAVVRLADLADAFLSHDRPIQRALDDSILRIVADDILMLRRARGYAPTVRLHQTVPPRLALGGHLKSTIAMGRGDHLILSQHLGDLDNAASVAHFQDTVADLTRMFAVKPIETRCDRHPDYGSSLFGLSTTHPIPVQHHIAHIRSCLAEHCPEFPVLGVAFDGLGLGTDGGLWGGEFFIMQGESSTRIASFRPFLLPGGVQAVREPRRVAVALLYQMWGAALSERLDLAPLVSLQPVGVRNLIRMMQAGLNCPGCSSVGRLYDAVASLLDVCQINRYEGEAALRVECLAGDGTNARPYPFAVQAPPDADPPYLIDWHPLFAALVADLPSHTSAQIAARFQRTLIEIVAHIAAQTGLKTIALSGGVFQNAGLTTGAVNHLATLGYTVLRHRFIPPNDGGLAVGQLLSSDVASNNAIPSGQI
ncbi:MAG: carbamoyltransferase HypF [Methylococcaceae bacterium]